MSEANIDEERVQQGHLASVNVGAHWLYLIGVLVGGTALMVLLIAVLGALTG